MKWSVQRNPLADMGLRSTVSEASDCWLFQRLIWALLKRLNREPGFQFRIQECESVTLSPKFKVFFRINTWIYGNYPQSLLRLWEYQSQNCQMKCFAEEEEFGNRTWGLARMIESHTGQGQEGTLEWSWRSHKDNSLSLDKYPSDLGKTPQASPAGLHCLRRPLEHKSFSFSVPSV